MLSRFKYVNRLVKASPQLTLAPIQGFAGIKANEVEETYLGNNRIQYIEQVFIIVSQKNSFDFY